jgi:hypothetical protein
MASILTCWRIYFARSPGSDIWVGFGDLPTATQDALWNTHEKKLAFPAGLEALATYQALIAAGAPEQVARATALKRVIEAHDRLDGDRHS